jgi:hypothetical protein
MTPPTAYHQLGKFVVAFQHIEAAINDILVLLAHADDAFIFILINELEYAQRAKTADVLFARFVDVRRGIDPSLKAEFHTLMTELGKLGERRNELVHSRYSEWVNVSGDSGLLRENAKLRASKGIREELEEELLPDAFNPDLDRVGKA